MKPAHRESNRLRAEPWIANSWGKMWKSWQHRVRGKLREMGGKPREHRQAELLREDRCCEGQALCHERRKRQTTPIGTTGLCSVELIQPDTFEPWCRSCLAFGLRPHSSTPLLSFLLYLAFVGSLYEIMSVK